MVAAQFIVRYPTRHMKSVSVQNMVRDEIKVDPNPPKADRLIVNLSLMAIGLALKTQSCSYIQCMYTD